MEGFFLPDLSPQEFAFQAFKISISVCKAISSLDIYYFLLFISSGEKISMLPSVHFREDKGLIHTVNLQISKQGIYFKFRTRRGAYLKGGHLFNFS